MTNELVDLTEIQIRTGLFDTHLGLKLGIDGEDFWRVWITPQGLVLVGNGLSEPTPLSGGGGGAVATDAIWDIKGDLAVGTGPNTAAKLPVGANGLVLAADSVEATGLKWIALAGPPAPDAPPTANYLVGTADAGLSAEIVVGTSPGGELGGTWASPTVDATHSGSTHAAAQAAAEATAQAALDAHTGDTADAHDASAISYAGGTGMAATDVEAALDELATEKANAATFPVLLMYAISDETTALTTGTGKLTVRVPYAFTLTAVRASLTTASSSGIPTFDVNETGTTVLSTKLTVDANEKTSTTAATPAVISDAAIADDAELTFDIDVAGTGAAGAKIYLIGTRAL